MSEASRRVTKLDARLRADVKLLNDRGVHIVMARDHRGKRYPLDRETLHALAEVVRAYDRSKEET